MITINIQNNIAVLGINIANQPMNVLNNESIPALSEALEKVYTNPDVKGIILTSERPEFIAGADLKMILQNNGRAPEELFKLSMSLNTIFRKMETNGKPIVAAMNGTALGGGYEVCLACHHRVALNNPKSIIGLPEVTIGLLPGGGGTQRLPRMIGMEAAAPLLLEGKRVSPKDALAFGMVDQLADSPEEMFQKAVEWIEAHPIAVQPWDEVDKKTGKIKARENFKVPGGNVLTPKGVQLMMGGTAMTLAKTQGNYPAPIEIMSCVYEGLLVNIDRGIVIEARHFVKVANSSVAKNLIRTTFFGLNEVNKGAGRPKNVPVTQINSIGILGAGMMGAGIAYVSAQAGLKVVLKDTSLENAEKGKDYSRKLLQKGIERGKMTAEKAEQILALIQTTDIYESLQDVDLIIEAVFENPSLKANVTQEAEKFLREDGVFASNTSTLPITELAKATQKQENFIGIHFFSPVDKMQLVEIIVGKQTSDYALAMAMDYVKKIRKTPIVVNDSRGFYTSRVFSTYTSEGLELLKDGVNPVVIENVAKQMGFPVGPLAVSDEVALDLAYKISHESVQAGVLSPDDTAYQISKQFTEMGRLGKKAKAGFYEYPDPTTGKKKYLWEGLSQLFPLNSIQPSAEDIKQRLFYRQVLETVKCFEEGVLRTPLDADLGSIFAWGFPAYLGGTLSFVDTVGIVDFVKECDRLADTYGDRFRPTTQLREMAEANKGFY
ncbi:3-hydroxyacyl-CoA dehydrogenase NAD-binding domain-containing protein [Flectobacillus rhizosphaerae]|uniref:3-hydroxyacyl-CoA dehydrogenase NAD-binding domain-containing protein n=2 Tax=Flectobacillus roseus TaxID=502259 RepID=A0ABT6Y993_9BACT|nr:3-hydroxyacyl-CoA dehydrogenase NAD-binding domain-containing protein [Flectobacillus roseus]MDI9860153.1 3-hydroxyacyl-CoA dehydrogenase NAD-binding domain-containing protein [Flectobacillus roseus]